MALQNVEYISENIIYPQFIFLDSTFEEFNSHPITPSTGEDIFNLFVQSLKESDKLKIYPITAALLYYRKSTVDLCHDQQDSLLMYWMFLNRYLLVYNRNHPKLQSRKAFFLYIKQFIKSSQNIDFSEIKSVGLQTKINHADIQIPPYYKIDKEYLEMVLGLDNIKL